MSLIRIDELCRNLSLFCFGLFGSAAKVLIKDGCPLLLEHLRYQLIFLLIIKKMDMLFLGLTFNFWFLALPVSKLQLIPVWSRYKYEYFEFLPCR